MNESFLREESGNSHSRKRNWPKPRPGLVGKKRGVRVVTRVWLGIGSDWQQGETTVPRALNDSLAVCLFPMSNTELGAVL